MTKIAFYSPLKPFDHPIPSGDRLIAGNLIKALKCGGIDVRIASKFIAYLKRPNKEQLELKRSKAKEEALKITQSWEKEGYRPDLFLTYHPYSKSPDWIGPYLKEYFNIPYATIEACQTGQEGFNEHQKESEKGILKAQKHFYFKPADRDYLKSLGIEESKMIALPPFIDNTESLDSISLSNIAFPSKWKKETATMICVALMRPGKKVDNYKFLADSLADMKKNDWQLIIVGGGPEENIIKEYFAKKIPAHEEKIHWTGMIKPSEVQAWMSLSHFFVWPGLQEPIGMVYLEAARNELPCVATNSMGAPLVIKENYSGLITSANNPSEYTQALEELINNSQKRSLLGQQALKYLNTERSIKSIGKFLRSELEKLI